MKKNKILTFILCFVLLISGLFPLGLRAQNKEITPSKTKVADSPTPSKTLEEMATGEVFVDKSVFDGTLTIDQHNFSTENFLIQLEAISKQAFKSKEPIDAVLLLDTTLSTGNPIYGSYGTASYGNGAADDFVIAINEFINILMNSNPQNKVAVICYGGRRTTDSYNGKPYLIGSEPMEVLLELGHYENPSWSNPMSYNYEKQGAGSPSKGNYRGGTIIRGKYIDFIESNKDVGALDYLPSALRSKYKYLNSVYAFRLATPETLNKDNVLYPIHKNYGGWNGTYTQNAMLKGLQYLKENIQGETAILLLLTDGEANIGSPDYKQYVDYKDPSYTKKCTGNFVDIGTELLISSSYVRKELEASYQEVFIYTSCAYLSTAYSQATLNPTTIATSSDSTVAAIRTRLRSFYGPTKNTFLTNGTRLINDSGLTSYIYPDKFYFSNNINSLVENLKNTITNIIGSATNGIKINDTIGDGMDLKKIVAFVKDNEVYTGIKSTVQGSETIYSVDELPNITAVVKGQEVTFNISPEYINNKIKLIFEAGLSDSFIYDEKIEEYKLNTNKSCNAEFTLSEKNTYSDFNKTINKTNNKTNTKEYISKGTIQDKLVNIDLGNNGELILSLTKDLKITKQWNDNNNQDGYRPSEIKVWLYQDGQKTDKSLILSSKENWTGSFTHLPKNINGKAVTYTVKEDEITGYTANYENKENEITITNTHVIEKTELNVSKTWNDDNNKIGKRPLSVEVKLFADNQDTGKKIVLNKENNWSGSFNSLDKKSNGVNINYSVLESPIPESEGFSYSPSYNKVDDTHFNIKNTIEGNLTITLHKIWNDESNKYKTRPDSLEVYVLKNNNKIKTATLTPENNWTTTVELPAFDNEGKFQDCKDLILTEDLSNRNLMYFYSEISEFSSENKTISFIDPFDSVKKDYTYVSDLFLKNSGDWDDLDKNSATIHQLIFTKKIKSETNSFDKIKIPNKNNQFKIKLQQMNRILSKGETSMVESYEGFSGNEYYGILTVENELIFNDIQPGKYKVEELPVQYFEFLEFTLKDHTSGATLIKEGNEYYIQISGLSKNDEKIEIETTNKIDDFRPYDKTETKNNLFKA